MSSSSRDYITINALADELNRDRSNFQKYVKKLGVNIEERRTPESRNQLTMTVTLEDAKFIRNKMESEGFTSDTTIVSVPDRGFFYIIQVAPELDPRRLKLGFAENVETRLSDHKTAAPTATVLKSWPCKRVWEKTIIDALTVRHCRLIQNEVFECDSYEKLEEVGNKIFDILPGPQDTVSLSEYSPLARQDEVLRKPETDE